MIEPYTSWEDWKAGMYDCVSADKKSVMRQAAVRLLADANRLEDAMQSVVDLWSVSCIVHLTQSPNNRSWLGQAACCFVAGCTEECTRQAWGDLTQSQQELANSIADTVINRYQSARRGRIQLEFQFNA